MKRITSAQGESERSERPRRGRARCQEQAHKRLPLVRQRPTRTLDHHYRRHPPTRATSGRRPRLPRRRQPNRPRLCLQCPPQELPIRARGQTCPCRPCRLLEVVRCPRLSTESATVPPRPQHSPRVKCQVTGEPQATAPVRVQTSPPLPPRSTHPGCHRDHLARDLSLQTQSCKHTLQALRHGRQAHPPRCSTATLRPRQAHSTVSLALRLQTSPELPQQAEHQPLALEPQEPRPMPRAATIWVPVTPLRAALCRSVAALTVTIRLADGQANVLALGQSRNGIDRPESRGKSRQKSAGVPQLQSRQHVMPRKRRTLPGAKRMHGWPTLKSAKGSERPKSRQSNSAIMLQPHMTRTAMSTPAPTPILLSSRLHPAASLDHTSTRPTIVTINTRPATSGLAWTQRSMMRVEETPTSRADAKRTTGRNHPSSPRIIRT